MEREEEMKAKKQAVLVIMLFLFTLCMMGLTAAADDDPRPRRITAVQKQRTVYVGTEFEVKVRTYPRDADEDALRWTIVKGRNIIRFDDDDRTDNEVEIKAVRAGTAKLRCQIRGTRKYAYVTVTVKKRATTSVIKRVGNASRTVTVGNDFELKVKKSSGLKDRYLRWSIQDSSVLRFDDDSTGDEVELKARKSGTTKVTCKNTRTGKTVVYTVTVKARNIDRYDDDWDDDDRYDDDWDDDRYDDDWDDDRDDDRYDDDWDDDGDDDDDD